MCTIEDTVEQMLKIYIQRHLNRPMKFIKLNSFHIPTNEQYLCSDIEIHNNDLLFHIYPMSEFKIYKKNKNHILDEKYWIPSVCTANTLMNFLDKTIDRTSIKDINNWFKRNVKYKINYNKDIKNVYMCKNDYKNYMMTFYLMEEI